MNDHTLIFLFELLMSDTEKGLYQSLKEDPHDEATRNAYIDLLKEQGRHESAKMLQTKWFPTIGLLVKPLPTASGYGMIDYPIGSGGVYGWNLPRRS